MSCTAPAATVSPDNRLISNKKPPDGTTPPGGFAVIVKITHCADVSVEKQNCLCYYVVSLD